MRIRFMSLTATMLAITASPAAMAAETPAAAGRVPADRASYFADGDLKNIWKDLEARQLINQRIVEGGSYSVNVRVVRPTDAPLVHGASIDVWIVTAGTATAVTGGELLNPVQRPNSDDIAGTAIRGGTDQPLKQGDVVFVPAGVPHGFRNLKGFRAFLVRFDSGKPAAKP
jgi:mannose-6-phosphate isomerase-like protein (cupin superfamily)